MSKPDPPPTDHDHHARLYRALRDTGTMIWRAGWAGWARVQCGYPEKPLPEEWAIHPLNKNKQKGKKR